MSRGAKAAARQKSADTSSGARLRTLTQGQRVKVITVYDRSMKEHTINALGTVERMRTDGGAWVELDKRCQIGGVHPFTEDDSRGRHVLAYPEECEPDTKTGNRKERRANQKVAAQSPTLAITQFGKDHWSTFGYIASCVINHAGVLHNARMRCDPKRHPFMGHPMSAHAAGFLGPTPPTRLKGDEVLHNHDDWDCADDLETHGLVENIGTNVNRVFRLTDRGADVWRQWTLHQQNGGTFAKFQPTLPGAIAEARS